MTNDAPMIVDDLEESPATPQQRAALQAWFEKMVDQKAYEVLSGPTHLRSLHEGSDV